MAQKKGKIMNALIDELTKDGEELIKLAYNTRGWRNDTYNLHDSYASAVYVHGVLYRRTIRYVGAEMQRIPYATGHHYEGERTRPNRHGERYLDGDEIYLDGRDEAIRFFSDYTPIGNGIELVIIAAMFYGNILESRHYQVISGATSMLLELKKKYGGAKAQTLDVRRDLDKVGAGSFHINSRQNI